MTKVKRFASLFLVIAMLFTAFATLVACKDKIDNESTRLVIASQELDGVFNPFFSSSGPDNSIVGMTQISMLSADKDANVAVGEKEACVVLDYEQKDSSDSTGKYTTYRFVLKNNIKFSNGTPLTMKDVLFNLYVYLDPAYTGSSTIYSTDIVGLAAYRTQIADEFGNEQENSDEGYEKDAWFYLEHVLADELYLIYTTTYQGEAPSDAQVKAELQALQDESKENMEKYPDDPQYNEWKQYSTLVEDYERAQVLFMEELETDYTNAIGTAEDIKYEDKSGNMVHLDTDTEAFLFSWGYITWDKEEKKFEYNGDKNTLKNMSREAAIQMVYNTFVNDQTTSEGMIKVLLGTGSTYTLVAEFIARAKKEYYESLDEAAKIKNIKGITFANRLESVTVKGVTYPKVEYAADGSVANDTHEVLEIKIKDVDPKAIWNFGFTVAPMYYYSSQEEINKFDFIEHFGVSYSDVNFMNDYVKATDKIGLPVGAGPYKATTVNGDSAHVTSATFKQNNVVYFERNEHFMFPVKIKYVNYQVVDTKLMVDSLFNGDIHFAEPACKQENIDRISAKSKSGFAYGYVQTNGYGYIGINAEKVPDVRIRRAIMHAIDTSLCLAYYGSYASPIYRPMSQSFEWAYPQNAKSERGTANEQYYYFDGTGAVSAKLAEEAGYTKNSKGILQNKNKETLEYTFTIAGDDTDHPAYNAMQRAATILNNIGFNITVKKDINALKKLNTGDLAVWAAAWGSGVDPDMYQVYHIDSQAGSTANWGYRAIKRDKTKYKYELDIVTRLSEIIDKARSTTDQTIRAAEYERALNLVMELAVELPTYQRSDLFAYNTKYIDASTLTQKTDLSSFNGPLARLWEVSFVNQK